MRGRTAANVAMVAAFALLCTGGLSFLAVAMGLEVPGLRSGWRLEASFASTEGLVTQSDVDVAGVRVGRVVGIAADGSGGTLVSMVIDGNVRVRQDARALLRPKSLIGEKFVELVRRPGSTTPYAPDGYRLPRAQTGQAVELDQILNQLDPQTRSALSSSLRELGVALDQREDDVSASIPEVEQAAANLRPLARTADARQQQIDRILTDLAIIMAALADEQDAVGHVVDSGDVAASALAKRDRELAGTVQQADRLLGSLDTVLADTTPADRAALERAPGTVGAGRQLLSNLNPTVDRLLPELLLAQVNYPSNQLAVSHPEGVTLAYEWISAFAQNDAQGHSFRLAPLLDPSTALRQPGLPGSVPLATPGAPATPAAPGAAANTAPAQGGLLPDATQRLLGRATK